ncbi:MAG: TraB/GumN family protein [Hyphomicrobiales bacterium]|nr:TraB/GumN family protein [Hyphomicrobiales bacterium]
MRAMRILTLGALALLLAMPAAAASPAPGCAGKDLSGTAGLAAARERRADDLLNADGLLWRIEKPNLAPSYLFGTIHSTDDGSLSLARRAADRIEGAKVAATELGALDAVQKADMAAKLIARGLDYARDTFEDLPQEDRPGVATLAAAKGVGEPLAHHMKLWLLALLTATPACESERRTAGLAEVDEYLAEAARKAGVKVVGLETVDEQIEAISTLRREVVVPLLAAQARAPGLDDDVYATMLRLYHESRPAEILAVVDAVGGLNPDERAAEEEFTRLLLRGRNAVMAERAAPLLAQGGAFIAVGALHLAGKDGLIERFRAMGYAIVREW